MLRGSRPGAGRGHIECAKNLAKSKKHIAIRENGFIIENTGIKSNNSLAFYHNRNRGIGNA